MEFPFSCDRLFGADKDGYSVIDSNAAKKYIKTPSAVKVIDMLGTLSAKSQALGAVITTTSKILGSDHRMYMKTEGSKVIGFIKVGKKNLFIRNMSGKIFEISPLCVLDFYVHESTQRCGYGKVRLIL